MMKDTEGLESVGDPDRQSWIDAHHVALYGERERVKPRGSAWTVPEFV